MKRREFIAVIGGTMAAWPLSARAQQAERARRIGVLMGYAESDPDAQANVAAFREGLQKLGSPGVGGIGRLSPDTVKGYVALNTAGRTKDQLGAKIREMIACAGAVTLRRDGCIALHTDAAVRRCGDPPGRAKTSGSS